MKKASFLVILFFLSVFLMFSCSKDKEQQADKQQQKNVQKEEVAEKTVDKEPEADPLIPLEHTKNYFLGWSQDSIHFGFVTVETDKNGLLTWRLWVYNAMSGSYALFGNGTQMTQGKAFTDKSFKSIEDKNLAAYQTFYDRYWPQMDSSGFGEKPVMGGLELDAESKADDPEFPFKPEWELEFSSADDTKYKIKMDLTVSKRKAKKTEETLCPISQSLLKVEMFKEGENRGQYLKTGQNYLPGLTGVNPRLLSISPNGMNMFLLFEKFSKDSCKGWKTGYMGLEPMGGPIKGTRL